MSKHQTCCECSCGFVGPDLNIGSNLCESCGQELHGECQEELAIANTELDRLREIVDALPKCWTMVDGKLEQTRPVVPGLRVWKYDKLDDEFKCHIVADFSDWGDEDEMIPWAWCKGVGKDARTCADSREAAAMHRLQMFEPEISSGEESELIDQHLREG